jgi:hypothetical protein
MQELANPAVANDHTLEQVLAREHYFRLRDTLVRLKSASVPNLAEIDTVIGELEQAQLAYKATHGVYGNNPLADAPATQAQTGGMADTSHAD